MTDHSELRNLESWHDEDALPLDESCYQELVDPSNPDGWSADDMFKYNERRHKITSSYNERITPNDRYTTPLSKNNSKNTNKMASQLAKEIEERNQAQGRITPESSDDDELFEAEKKRRMQLKKRGQLDQSQTKPQLQSPNQLTPEQRLLLSNLVTGKTPESSSKRTNSTKTPNNAPLSSSSTDNTKPVSSSSRNILRTCLT